MVVEYGDGDNLAIHAGDSANRICFMATHGGSEKQWRAIQANAALIAAAPTVDAAARAFLDSYDRAENAVTLATRIKALRAALALTAGEN